MDPGGLPPFFTDYKCENKDTHHIPARALLDHNARPLSKVIAHPHPFSKSLICLCKRTGLNGLQKCLNIKK